jgi:hypothetical protein
MDDTTIMDSHIYIYIVFTLSIGFWWYIKYNDNKYHHISSPTFLYLLPSVHWMPGQQPGLQPNLICPSPVEFEELTYQKVGGFEVI